VNDRDRTAARRALVAFNSAIARGSRSGTVLTVEAVFRGAALCPADAFVACAFAAVASETASADSKSARLKDAYRFIMIVPLTRLDRREWSAHAGVSNALDPVAHFETTSLWNPRGRRPSLTRVEVSGLRRIALGLMYSSGFSSGPDFHVNRQ
jgi:hypothetical protein